jgi:L-malate glycosyltransferase
VDRVKRQPRVLQVLLSLHPGGTERLVVELATRLHAELPTMVCCLDERGAWAAGLEEKGIGVAALGRQPGFQPSLGLRIAEIVKAHGASVIHAHHYSPFVYSAVARMRHPATRLVFTEHGRLSDAPPSGKRRIANQLLGSFPHRMFAVSDNLRQHMIGEGFRRGAVDVIYNGIDIGPRPTPAHRSAVRARLGVSDDQFVIGTVARLDPVKDLGTLLEALRLIGPERDPRVALVGDGPERLALERVATELGVADRVMFLGHRDDAREWLAGCDVYANSSISEGVSLTILEGMAAALPVVATRVGGTPEVIDETCGWLVPARDPGALAGALLECARDRRRAAALGDAARTRVEIRFTLDRMVSEYRQAYLSPLEIAEGAERTD